MIRGISYKIPNKKSEIALWDMLGCINIEKYAWYNIGSQNEVWSTSLRNAVIDEPFYSGKQFISIIQQNHYIIFIKLEAYLDTTEEVDIHSYNEFIKSACELLLLINDCQFVEIYTKNIKELELLYETAKNNGYEEVTYITDDNDDRTVLDVL